MDFSTIAIITTAIVLVVTLAAGLSIANFAYDSFYEKYQKLDKKHVSISPIEFYQHINNSHLGGRVMVGQTKPGEDAYSGGVIFLSQQTVNSWSLASLSIIAHELGHAKQDQTSSKLKKLSRLRKAGRFVGVFMFPLLLAGLVLTIIGGNLFYIGIGLAAGGLFIFLLAIIIKAVTIRIEKEASKNALVFLREVLQPKDVKACKKFLDGAKLTYWADMFRTLLAWTMLTRKTKLFR